jgi:ElaB/YqjD/DUF883 family membrane-anchored ribosome-binding protein
VAEIPRNSPVDTAAERARTATDRIATKATDAIASVQSSIHDSVNSVAERANSATQWTSDKIEAVKRAPTDGIEAGAEYIRANPYAAVGVALAVGYVLGRVDLPPLALPVGSS